MLAAMLATLWIAPAMAQDKEAYAVLDGGTLTFYYDADAASRPGTHFDMPAADERPAWTNGNFTTAHFDTSFAQYTGLTSLRSWFYECNKLAAVTGLANLNTANVTNTQAMFSGCSGLTSLDLSSFNTANVTDMQGMFSGCRALTSLDLSGFNTANVTSMGWMFYNCEALASLDLSGFNTANVTNMGWMFTNCYMLPSLDLSSFNTANVTDMSLMFSGCRALTSLDLSGFNTAKVTSMHEMFYGCSELASLDLSSFNTANVTDMQGMFEGCAKLASLDLSSFNTAKVTNMQDMLQGCAKLASLDLSSFNTANVTDMQGMFSGCRALTSLDLSGFNTAKVYDMRDMFLNCGELKTIYCNDAWTCSEYNHMFEGCVKLVGAVPYDPAHVDITYANPETGYFTRTGTGTPEAYVVKSEDDKTITFYYDTQRGSRPGTVYDIDATQVESGVTSPMWAGGHNHPNRTTTTAVFDDSFKDYRLSDIKLFFFKMHALEQIVGIENLNTSEVTDMSNMFRDCRSLTAIDVTGFNTEKVTNLSCMFWGCTNLQSLDLANFNTARVTNMGSMFQDCENLTTIYCNDTWTCYSSNYMFGGCTKLIGAVPYDSSETSVDMANPDNGYFTHTDGFAKYNLTICGAQVTSANCADLTAIEGVTVAAGGKVTFDPETNTLTLKDASIVPTAYDYPENGIMATIDSLVIHVEGTNRVANNYDGYAIRNTGTLTIDGTGSLDAQGGNAGIYSTKNVLVRNCTVTAGGEEGIWADSDNDIHGNIDIANATVTATGEGDEENAGLMADKDIVIDQSTVTATGSTWGIWADKTLAVMQSTVTATGTGEASVVSGREPVLTGCAVTQPVNGEWLSDGDVHILCLDGEAVKTEVVISPDATTYDVVLLDAGPDRKAVTDSLKSIAGIPLSEAIILVGNAPGIVLADVPQAEAQHLADALASVGATVQVVPHGTWVPSGITSTVTDVPVRRQGIYSMEGVKLNQTWESLPKGVYIVNGKKAVKR